jgi:hypothetical protein
VNDAVLQTSQFFRERVARGEAYEKRHHNGHAADDKHEDDEDHGRDGEQSPDDVREIEAHKNVFHRP